MRQKGPWWLRWFKPKFIVLQGYRVDDLKFLGRHRDTARHLRIVGKERLDVSAIHQLRGLEMLSISAGGADQVLELRRFRNLRVLRVHGGIQIDWTDANPEIEEISVDTPSEAEAAFFASLPNLEVLGIYDGGHVPAAFAGPMHDLEIDGPVILPQAPIGGLAGLETLELSGDILIDDLSLFAGAGPLDMLAVDGLPRLRSLQGVTLAEGADLDIFECPQLTDLAGLDATPGVTVTRNDDEGSDVATD